MARKGQPGFRSFVRYRKERLSRGMVVDLKEIDPASLEISDRLSSLLCIGDATAERPLGSIIEDRPRCDNLGSGQFAAVDAIPERQNKFGIAAHIAGTNDALRQKQIQQFPAGDLVMRVHIPKAGDEKLSGAVHPYRSAGD